MAAVFAVTWLILPWWLFLLVALYCYFIPFFWPGKLFVPFFCLMVLTVFLFAVVFGVIFYYILLIKDLVIVNRRSAYEILVITLSFFLIRDFFITYNGINGSAFFWSFWLAVAIGLLVYSMMSFFKADVISSPLSATSISDVHDNDISEVVGDYGSRSFFFSAGLFNEGIEIKKPHLRPIAFLLVTFLSWQFIIIGLFLPLDFVYQSIIVFIAVTFFCELIAGYFWNDISRERIFFTASIFFSILVILLASATWKL